MITRIKEKMTPHTTIWVVGTICILLPIFALHSNPIPGVLAYFGSQSIWSIVEKILE